MIIDERTEYQKFRDTLTSIIDTKIKDCIENSIYMKRSELLEYVKERLREYPEYIEYSKDIHDNAISYIIDLRRT